MSSCLQGEDLSPGETLEAAAAALDKHGTASMAAMNRVWKRMVEKRNASRSNRRRNSQAGAASDQRARSRADAVKKRVAAIRADGPASYEIDEHGKCNCKDISPTCVCDLCPDDRHAEGLTAARELDYKFHAATNVVMDMEHDEKTRHELIDGGVRVSDERKAALYEEWRERMAPGAPLCSCASCGLRDPREKYEENLVSKLPDVFRLNERGSDKQRDKKREQNQRVRACRDALRDVQLYVQPRAGDDPILRSVDASRIVSCYKDAKDQLWYLHPELVDESTPDEAKVFLCGSCLDKAKVETNESDPPNRSLADGVDYGWLARVPGLEPLSDLEAMLISDVRLYHTVVKVSARSNTRSHSRSLALRIPFV